MHTKSPPSQNLPKSPKQFLPPSPQQLTPKSPLPNTPFRAHKPVPPPPLRRRLFNSRPTKSNNHAPKGAINSCDSKNTSSLPSSPPPLPLPPNHPLGCHALTVPAKPCLLPSQSSPSLRPAGRCHAKRDGGVSLSYASPGLPGEVAASPQTEGVFSSLLLADLLDPTNTPHQICQLHNLSLSQLAAITNSAEFQQAVADIQSINTNRSAAIDSTLTLQTKSVHQQIATAALIAAADINELAASNNPRLASTKSRYLETARKSTNALSGQSPKQPSKPPKPSSSKTTTSPPSPYPSIDEPTISHASTQNQKTRTRNSRTHRQPRPHPQR